MIYVNCALKQDFIISTLEGYTDGIKFTFDSKKGIKLAFNVDTEDLDEAVKVAKALIKATELGAALYFQVTK